MLRELSAVWLAAYTALIILLVAKVHDGASAFREFADSLRSPGLVLFAVVTLAFALLHSVTWFRAMPSVLPPGRGEDRVARLLVIGVPYGLMLGLTGIVLGIVLA
jgi:fumarate reductase subunit C